MVIEITDRLSVSNYLPYFININSSKSNITEVKLILNFYAFGKYAEPVSMSLFEVRNA